MAVQQHLTGRVKRGVGVPVATFSSWYSRAVHSISRPDPTHSMACVPPRPPTSLPHQQPPALKAATAVPEHVSSARRPVRIKRDVQLGESALPG